MRAHASGFVTAALAVWAAGGLAAQGSGSVAPADQTGSPRVVIDVSMATKDMLVTDQKYRVMFNKLEQKSIPLTDFDFASNLGDELQLTLSEDKRAQWRLARSDEQATLASLFGPDSGKKKTYPPPSVEADRILLVDAGYSAFISAVRKYVEVKVGLRMVDRRSGEVLWKKSITEHTGLPDTLEDMQADNQKVLKETLNKAMEQLTPKVKAHIVGTAL